MKFPQARHLDPRNEGADTADKERWREGFTNAVVKAMQKEKEARRGNVR